MTLGDRVAGAREALVAAGIRAQDAALDAEVLARHVLAWDRAGFVVRLRDEEPAGFADAYRALVDRRRRREPVAYIVGAREFWGLPFEVTPDVLIPRPETELIVEEALELFPAGHAPAVIVDAGTGSGCLAVALALEFAQARVIATDISEAALAVARRNAAANGAAQRIDFRAGDLLAPVTESADLIVSNPPYVASGDAPGLVPEVREHEPHVALFAGGDGLAVFEKLFPSAATRLRPGGRLIVEVGYDQDERVARIASRDGWSLSHVRQDLQAITRTLIFVREPSAISHESSAMSPESPRDCLFCKIGRKEIPASLTYEDDRMFVLNDIKPQAPLHALVIPKRHIATLNALTAEDEALVGAMMRRAAAVAAERGYAERGFRTVFNTNADAGQAVYHIHLHVLGGRQLTWPPG